MKPFNPKSTVFTNLMLDIIMPAVPPNAWKILCFAMRKTAGWADLSTYSGRKESDIISLSQFMKGCGIKSENTVMEAIDFCLEKGYLLREPDGQSFRYRMNTEYELTTSDIEVVNDLTSSENEEVTSSKTEETNSNINIKDHTREEYLKNIEARKEQTKESIKKFEESNSIPNLGDYPEDVRHILKTIYDLWKIALPSKKSMQYGYWLRGSRELSIACEGHPDIVLYNIKKDLDDRKTRNKITISSPTSLINMARAKVGELKVQFEGKDKPIVPKGASEVWIGGQRYTG